MTMQKIKIAAVVAVVVIAGVGGGVVAVRSASSPSTPTTMPVVSAPPPVATLTKWPVKFSNGAVVEVVGIQDENPADPNAWWAADGSPALDPRNTDRSRFFVDGGANTRNVRFVVRMSNAPLADTSFRAGVLFSWNQSSSSVDKPGGVRMLQLLAAIPVNAQQTDLKIGVADGKWTDELDYDVASGRNVLLTNLLSAPFQVSDISEEKKQTVVTSMALPIHTTERDEQLVAVTPKGEISFQRSEGGLMKTKYYFNCAKNDLQRLVYRTRPFEWHEMKNVSVKPSTMPSDVQVSTISAPGTKPAD